jgi:hypothetical protein
MVPEPIDRHVACIGVQQELGRQVMRRDDVVLVQALVELRIAPME